MKNRDAPVLLSSLIAISASGTAANWCNLMAVETHVQEEKGASYLAAHTATALPAPFYERHHVVTCVLSSLSAAAASRPLKRLGIDLVLRFRPTTLSSTPTPTTLPAFTAAPGRHHNTMDNVVEKQAPGGLPRATLLRCPGQRAALFGAFSTAAGSHGNRTRRSPRLRLMGPLVFMLPSIPVLTPRNAFLFCTSRVLDARRPATSANLSNA